MSFFLGLCIVWNAFSQKISPTGNAEFDSTIQKAYNLRYVNWDSAKTMVHKAERLRSLTELQKAIIANQLGALYYIQGDYSISMKEYSKALEILEKEPHPYQKVVALNGRGLIYLSQHSYEQAAEIFQKCIELNQQLGDSTGLGTNYFNKGISISELGRHREALEILQQGIQYLQNFPESTLWPMYFNRFAQIHQELGDLAKAKSLFFKVLEENPDLNSWEKSYAYTGLGQIALKENQAEEALSYGEMAYAEANQAKALWDKERATALISKAYESQGRFEDALRYNKLTQSYRDSLYSQTKNSEISYLQLQLTEADRAALEKEKLLTQKEAIINKWISIGLGLMVIFAVVLLVLYRRWLKEKDQLNAELLAKQQEIIAQNEQLLAIDQEKNKLFSILSHDLKSPIKSVKQLLELQDSGLLDENELSHINKLLVKQIHHTDRMMDDLLKWSHAQLGGIVTRPTEIEIIPMIEDIISQNEILALKKHLKIHFSPTFDSLKIYADKAQFKIILQNCLQNAIKFSFEGGEIQIDLQEGKSNIDLVIQDFGTGISPEKLQEIEQKQTAVSSSPGTGNEIGTGIGMMLVKQFLKKNHGTLDIQSQVNQGTTIRLSFPKIS